MILDIVLFISPWIMLWQTNIVCTQSMVFLVFRSEKVRLSGWIFIDIAGLCELSVGYIYIHNYIYMCIIYIYIYYPQNGWLNNLMPMRFHIESLESYPNLPTILGWFNPRKNHRKSPSNTGICP